MAKPLPLSAPDGTVYTYACGVCHLAVAPQHFLGDSQDALDTPESVIRVVAQYAETARERADQCCRCWECRQPLPRPIFFDDRVCPDCLPTFQARQTETAAKNEAFVNLQQDSLAEALDKEAAEMLLRYMEDVSEDCWNAGWELGLEYALWDLAHAPFTLPTPDGDKLVSEAVARQPENWPKAIQRPYGQSKILLPTLATLRELAGRAGGWWVWTEGDDPRASGPLFVRLDKWLAMYAEDQARAEGLRQGALYRPGSPVSTD